MAKLYFRHGAMGSSKTANALMLRYNYLEKGKKVAFLKPKLENRDGERIIRSRIGLEAVCDYVEDFLADFTKDNNDVLDVIIIDEAQFMKAEEVEKFSDIADFCDIPVICYGLKSDFQSNMFEGSKRLFELADEIEELETVCWCGRKAHYNARISNGKIIRDGEQLVLGGNESYVSLCRKHFKLGLINK